MQTINRCNDLQTKRIDASSFLAPRLQLDSYSIGQYQPMEIFLNHLKSLNFTTVAQRRYKPDAVTARETHLTSAGAEGARAGPELPADHQALSERPGWHEATR